MATISPPSLRPKAPIKTAKDLSYLIISGGTGANSIASAFGPSPAFVLPVSDDGGSSSEILRCFGGPSIGDIRSRLIRLIPLPETDDINPIDKDARERLAIYNLMAYRFPAEADEKIVRDLWMEIVEGRSLLWDGIGEDKKECIRAFLVHFQTLCLRRAHKRFSFRNFSLGNGFLTGARDLFGSLPSAIFLFKSIAGLAEGVQVIPVINTNQTVIIAAGLEDGSRLVGQCNISHPASGTDGHPSIDKVPSAVAVKNHLRHGLRRDSRTFDTDSSLNSPIERQSLEEIRESIDTPPVNKDTGGNLGYRKGGGEVPLDARIERLFYINLYGQEVFPEPNPDYLETLSKRDILVYSCGSLWTSIVPCLSVRHLASAITSSPTLKAKSCLNSTNDRETPDYKASEYITTIITALRRYDKGRPSLPFPRHHEVQKLLTHLVLLEGGGVDVDVRAVEELAIRIIIVPENVHGSSSASGVRFNTEAVEWAMARVMEDLN